jgi:hypothetical protein
VALISFELREAKANSSLSLYLLLFLCFLSSSLFSLLVKGVSVSENLGIEQKGRACKYTCSHPARISSFFLGN